MISEEDIRMAIVNAIAYGHTTEAAIAKAVADKLRQHGINVKEPAMPMKPKPMPKPGKPKSGKC